jgi:hypothetical protein
MRLEIETTEVVATTEIRAAPGDKLMIYGGVCIGVSKPGPANRVRQPRVPVASEHDIVDVLAKFGPGTTGQVCDWLGLPMKDKCVRSVLGNVMRRMLAHGKLEIAPSHRTAVHIYRLSEKMPGAKQPSLTFPVSPFADS